VIDAEGHDLTEVPLGNHLAAVLAGPRPQIDDIVGGAHRRLVVLDHQHGVAQVAQALQRLDQRSLSRWCRPMLGSSRM
jgi:hypothetical protein